MIDIAVKKRQGAFTLDVAFTSHSGVTALFGRSGAGKSSVVAMTAGLARPDQGHIRVDEHALFDAANGIDLPPERRRVGLIFQDGRLFPHMTVAANLRYGERRTPAAERYVTFDRVVELLGIGPLLDRRPARLSGGEKQRVAIGRALLSSPHLLLMDEPLAALDGARKAEVLPFIARLGRELAVPILYVSHSIEEILELADDLVVLDDGKVVAAGRLEQVLCDTDLSSITGRLDAGSILIATVHAHLPDFATTRLALGPNWMSVPMVEASLGSKVRLRISAHDVSLATERPLHTSIQNVLSGTIASVRPEADGQVDVRVNIDGDGTLWTRVTQMAVAELGLCPGQPIFALVKTASIARSSIALRG
jgi:molybdate transport system ATP-binding protein